MIKRNRNLTRIRSFRKTIRRTQHAPAELRVRIFPQNRKPARPADEIRFHLLAVEIPIVSVYNARCCQVIATNFFSFFVPIFLENLLDSVALLLFYQGMLLHYCYICRGMELYYCYNIRDAIPFTKCLCNMHTRCFVTLCILFKGSPADNNLFPILICSIFFHR